MPLARTEYSSVDRVWSKMLTNNSFLGSLLLLVQFRADKKVCPTLIILFRVLHSGIGWCPPLWYWIFIQEIIPSRGDNLHYPPTSQATVLLYRTFYNKGQSHKTRPELISIFK